MNIANMFLYITTKTIEIKIDFPSFVLYTWLIEILFPERNKSINKSLIRIFYLF